MGGAAELDEFRTVQFNTPQAAEQKFCNNKIRTSLYVRGWLTPFIFIVEGVCKEEFAKLANFYFLVICALQVWSETSNTGGLPTTAPALIVVVGFASILKLMQDVERSQNDHTLNTARCERLVKGRFVVGVWTDVKVGDFVKVHNREMLPADIVLFATHEPDAEAPIGNCHVETKSLDGETNLKARSVPKLLCTLCGATPAQQVKALSTIAGQVRCEQPNPATTKFTGTVHIHGHPEVALSISNVLLRSSSVRNTDYVMGLVVNTGRDTKVMQGQETPPLKTSSIDRGINYLMLGVMSLQVVMCLACTVLNRMTYETLASSWYLQEAVGEVIPLANPIIGVLRFFVLLAAFVSVSLYVSVDSNKALTKVMMQKSKFMRHKPSKDAKETYCKVRTMQLVDELGCISHVFSDKTGTLTQNMMQFRKCSINGVSYGYGNTEIGLARLARLGQTPAQRPSPSVGFAPDAKGGPGGGRDGGSFNSSSSSSKGGGGAGGPSDAPPADVNFDGPELFAALRGEHGHQQQDACRDFLLLLALCHTVVVEQVGAEKKLSASSPDEAALVAAAAYFGIEFVNKQHSTVTLRDTFSGTQPVFEVLEVLSFSSARKRMSVVVQEPHGGRIRLLSKGADSVMLPLASSEERELRKHTEGHLEDHANDGLRTLVLMEKTLQPSEYAEWSKRYRAACTDLVQIEKMEREEPNEIERLMSEVEHGLHLVGSTAIEDKLQEGVPKAIADMGRAGIAVWVLTGDKEETAINIAFACELFDTATKMLVLNLKSHPSSSEVLKELHSHGSTAKAALRTAGSKHALVIDGEIITMVMGDPKLQLALLHLTLHCQSVIACRCAPSQKAQLVTLVKRNVKGAITLAIGDGANDVAMIQAAHVGVGISGQEGMQAANSADFSFGQFRFLAELLFVWGRNAYRRMAGMVYYIFYKNILLVLVTYWSIFFSAASESRIYIEAGLQFYNVIWTALPIWVCSLVDKDVSDALARKLPQLYHLGVRRVYFNTEVVLRWVLDALLESLALWFVLIESLEDCNTADGRSPGKALLGDYAFALVLTMVTLKLALKQYQVSWIQHGMMAICLGIWWPLAAVFNLRTWVGTYFGAFMYDYAGILPYSLGNPVYWLLLLLLPTGLLLPQYFSLVYTRFFYPEFRDLAMETEHMGLSHKGLERWRIPLALRMLPLRKDAPRTIKSKRSFWSWLFSWEGRGTKAYGTGKIRMA